MKVQNVQPHIKEICNFHSVVKIWTFTLFFRYKLLSCCTYLYQCTLFKFVLLYHCTDLYSCPIVQNYIVLLSHYTDLYCCPIIQICTAVPL
jgi:hypothetical protein